MTEPYIIRISSQKGGVGKSIVAINFSTALKALGYKVLLVDSDFSNPSIGVYLGLEDVNIGYKEVFLGRADPVRAIVPHRTTGLSILPGTISSKQFVPNRAEVARIIPKMRKLNYDFVVIDTQPGYLVPELLGLYDEAMIITTPEMSSLLAGIKLAHVYNDKKLKHGLVVNRVRNKKYELSISEIEEVYENRVSGVLPEDEAVPLSVAQHVPTYTMNKRSQFSRAIASMARLYTGRAQVEEVEEALPHSGGGGILAFLKRIFHLD